VTRRLFVAVLAVGLLGAGCSNDNDTATPPTVAADSLVGELHVAAAASLTEAFTALGKAFEAAHPAVRVTFNFAASSGLAEQINQGAPTDVFVAADDAAMKKVIDAGNAADARTIARNRLAILVEKGNPKGIAGLADLAKPGVVFVLCAPEVPCGRFGAAALAKASVKATPASLEGNVKAVVSKVTLGEADAGIVYVTDVKAAGRNAEGVDIDVADDPALEAVYPMAVMKASTNREAAAAWIDFVLSAKGRATLRTYGFIAP
jgi:molybdate transport system substrate-binding protein